MSQENVEIARLMSEYFNRGDREAFKELLAPNVEITPLRAELEGTVYRGPTSSSDFWADTDESWETLGFDPDEIRDLGDRVLLTGRLRGTGRQTGVEVDSRIGLI